MCYLWRFCDILKKMGDLLRNFFVDIGDKKMSNC